MPSSLLRGRVLPRIALVLACAWTGGDLVDAGDERAWAASTASSTVGVTVPIVTSISTVGCPSATAGITSFGSLPQNTTQLTTSDCTISWDTNASTAMLRVFQTDGVGAAMQSGGNSIADYVDGATDWDQGASAFGACLRLVGAFTTAGWTPNASCTQVDGSHWNRIPVSGDPTSRIAGSASTGSANLRFGIRTGATQAAGAYVAGLTFEVVAPDGGSGGVAPVAGTASVTGTVQIGQTLGASATGWNMGTPAGTFTYQWIRCGTSGGTCIDIPGATSASYVPTGADGGRTLRVRITATNVWGSASATSGATTVLIDDVGVEVASTTTSAGVNVTTISPVAPGAVFEGDLLVAHVAVRDGTDITFDTVPAGWTLAARTDYTNRIAMATYWKFATAAEPPSYTWGWTNPARRATAAIQSFSAAQPVTPITVTSSASGNSSTATAPSVAVPSNGSILLALFATRSEINFSDPNVPAMTQLWELTNVGNDVSAFGLGQLRGTGATGTRSATIPGGSEWAAQLVVINPRP